MEPAIPIVHSQTPTTRDGELESYVGRGGSAANGAQATLGRNGPRSRAVMVRCRLDSPWRAPSRLLFAHKFPCFLSLSPSLPLSLSLSSSSFVVLVGSCADGIIRHARILLQSRQAISDGEDTGGRTERMVFEILKGRGQLGAQTAGAQCMVVPEKLPDRMLEGNSNMRGRGGARGGRGGFRGSARGGGRGGGFEPRGRGGGFVSRGGRGGFQGRRDEVELEGGQEIHGGNTTEAGPAPGVEGAEGGGDTGATRGVEGGRGRGGMEGRGRGGYGSKEGGRGGGERGRGGMEGRGRGGYAPRGGDRGGRGDRGRGGALRGYSARGRRGGSDEFPAL